MKILMLARALPAQRKGGVPDHVWALARGLASRGIRVHLLSTRLEDGPAVRTGEGVTTHHLAGTRPDSLAGGWWKASARATAELHAVERFDLIHCQSSSGYSIVNTGLHRRLGVAAVVSQHGTLYDELATRWRNGFGPGPRAFLGNVGAIGIVLWKIAARDRRYLRSADAVIATSNEQRSLIARCYGVPDSKLFTVFNGMDLSLFTPGPEDGAIRRQHGIPPGAPLLLAVARLIRDKGVQNILDAMPAILGAHPACRLLVIGDGPYRARLEERARRGRAAAAVIFAGERDLEALPGYFRACDVFVNSTNQQNGYDLTMVEAMACGRPVVASDLGSTPTLITHGDDGLLVPPRDVPALAAGVTRLLSDGALRTAIGTNARSKVRTRFGLDAMVEGTLDVYRRVAAGPAPGGRS